VKLDDLRGERQNSTTGLHTCLRNELFCRFRRLLNAEQGSSCATSYNVVSWLWRHRDNYFARESGCEVLWWARLSVCLSVCPTGYLRNPRASFCACCLWRWLGPPPSNKPLQMHFLLCTTLLIYLTIGEHLQLFLWKTRGMWRSGICDTKPAISVTRSSLEPNLLQSVYRNSCKAYRLVRNLVVHGDLALVYFLGKQNFSARDILHTFCRSARSLAALAVMDNRKLFPEFRAFWSGVPRCMRKHASVLHWCTCKVVFRQVPYVCG